MTWYRYYQTLNLTGSTKKLNLLLRSRHTARYAIFYYFKIILLHIFSDLVDILQVYTNKRFKYTKWWLCECCWFHQENLKIKKSCSLTQLICISRCNFILSRTTTSYVVKPSYTCCTVEPKKILQQTENKDRNTFYSVLLPVAHYSGSNCSALVHCWDLYWVLLRLYFVE